SLNLRQHFMELSGSVWMPASWNISFKIKLLSFRVSGYFLAVYDKYEMPFHFEKGFFTPEVVRVKEFANKKDSAYWDRERPVPLTDEEEIGYHRKDSLARLKESAAYLDSLDAENNRFKIGKSIFPGYTYTKRLQGQSHHVSPLL